MNAVSTLEPEFEYEGGFEYEGELELEGALGQPAAATMSPLSPQVLRRAGPTAARSALAAGTRAAVLPEAEEEYEFEAGLENLATSGIVQAPPAAMMEHFGHAAAQTESEAEAEAFIGALIPLAAQLLPRVAPAVMRAAPGLIRGAANVVRTLRRNPVTRPLVRAVPTIVRRTVADVSRQVARGRPVTPQWAVRSLARQTNQVLSDPRRCKHVLRRSAAADRRVHRAARARPSRIAI